MGKFVKGSYATINEAEQAVDELVAQGYRRKLITLVTNEDTRNSLSNPADVTVNTKHAEDNEEESWWDKVKDVFTEDSYNDANQNDPGYQADEDVLNPYKKEINDGYIVVLVDDADKMDESDLGSTVATGMETGVPNRTVDETNKETDTQAGVPNRTVGGMGTDMDKEDTSPLKNKDTDEETIQLQEERLNVDKSEVQTGELHVKKEVKTETETVEVPVEHEEVTIERRPVKPGEKTTGNADMKEEDITIPVTEEQIEVTKRPVVTEEVNIKKDKEQEMKTVSEQVRKEDLDVETSGDVDVDNEGKDMNPRP